MSKNRTRTKDKYRVVYNELQRVELENAFRSSEYISIPKKQEIAHKLELSERQIKIWFQNRRAKKRKQQKRGQVSQASHNSSHHHHSKQLVSPNPAGQQHQPEPHSQQQYLTSNHHLQQQQQQLKFEQMSPPPLHMMQQQQQQQQQHQQQQPPPLYYQGHPHPHQQGCLLDQQLNRQASITPGDNCQLLQAMPSQQQQQQQSAYLPAQHNGSRQQLHHHQHHHQNHLPNQHHQQPQHPSNLPNFGQLNPTTTLVQQPQPGAGSPHAPPGANLQQQQPSRPSTGPSPLSGGLQQTSPQHQQHLHHLHQPHLTPNQSPMVQAVGHHALVDEPIHSSEHHNFSQLDTSNNPNHHHHLPQHGIGLVPTHYNAPVASNQQYLHHHHHHHALWLNN